VKRWAAPCSEAVAKVLPGVSKDEGRSLVIGVRTAFESGWFTLAATDSYRMALYGALVEGVPEDQKEAVILLVHEPEHTQ
jgi:DNA polymerase III sliding clamp (beta) subunit (PCNA family)